MACSDISDALKCNGGLGYNHAAGTKTHNVKHRIVMKASESGAIQAAGDATAFTWTWNHDLVLASLFNSQGSEVKVDGT